MQHGHVEGSHRHRVVAASPRQIHCRPTSFRPFRVGIEGDSDPHRGGSQKSLDDGSRVRALPASGRHLQVQFGARGDDCPTAIGHQARVGDRDRRQARGACEARDRAGDAPCVRGRGRRCVSLFSAGAGDWTTAGLVWRLLDHARDAWSTDDRGDRVTRGPSQQRSTTSILERALPPST